MQVMMNGEAVELNGTPLDVEQALPKFKVFDQTNGRVKMADLIGKPMLISVIPDIDTAVCSTQTRKFNQQADHYPAARFVTISNNTVAEQANWCAAEGVKNLLMLSDEELSFGYATNLYIPNAGFLARSIYVIDEDGLVTYREIVPEVGDEPNYVNALTALEKLVTRVDE